MARIEVKNVSVELPIYGSTDRSFKRSLIKVGSGGRVGLNKPDSYVIVRAITDISFSARDGDRIALIGRNGAGKTTLLRVLAGILEPTAGLVNVEGNISSLFNVGGILDGQATGYENIRQAGRLLNLRSEEISALVPEIEDFTELGGYLNLPVRTYSAGMTVRLAFGIATSISPEVLLLDEAIGAGDIDFVAKASERARALYGRSSIVVIASHDANLLKQICNKALWMEGGKIVAGGEIATVLDLYEESSHPIAEQPIMEDPPVVIFNGQAEDGRHPENVQCADLQKFWVAREGLESWIGLDYSELLKEPVRATRLKVRKWESLADEPLDEVFVETSNDGFKEDIRLVSKLSLRPGLGMQTHLVNSLAKGLQWRIRPASSGSSLAGRWGLNQIGIGFNEPEIICDVASSGNQPSYAVSESLDEAWLSAFDSPFPWLGMHFGEDKILPIFLSLRQWENGEMQHSVSAIHLECSDDNFINDVVHIANIPLKIIPNIVHRYEIPDAKLRPAAYWRVRPAHQMNSGCWAVSHLSFETN